MLPLFEGFFTGPFLGGIFLCLQLLCRPFEGIAVEKDQGLREFVHRKWPRIVPRNDAMKLASEEVLAAFRRANCTGIFLVGGPPCQPFSSLGSQAGFRDARASPCEHFCQLKVALAAQCVHAGIPFEALMEEVAAVVRQ